MKKKQPKAQSLLAKKHRQQIVALKRQTEALKGQIGFLESEVRHYRGVIAFPEYADSVTLSVGKQVLEAIGRTPSGVTPGIMQTIITRLETIKPATYSVEDLAKAYKANIAGETKGLV